MYKYVSLLVLLLSLSWVSFGQKPKSIVRFSLSSQELLTVTLNERDFQRVGTSLVFNDLPKKRHSVRIYKFRPYSDGQGGKAELLYSGNIKIEPGKTYDAVLDVRTNKLRVKQVRTLETLPTYKGVAPGTPSRLPNNQYKDEAISIENASTGLQQSEANTVFELPKNHNVQLSDKLVALQKKMNTTLKDTDKLKMAQQYLQQNSLSVQEAGSIVSWINFDDNKLEFLKAVSQKLKGQADLEGLADYLTLKESKQRYLDGLQ